MNDTTLNASPTRKDLVSVIIPVYNAQRYLPELLSSLDDQGLDDRQMQVIIVDDGSTDDTVSLLRAFTAAAPFPVRIDVNPVRLGSTANFAAAFARCTGDVIFPCDQDDFWRPEKLARMAAVFADEERVRAAPDYALFYDAPLERVRLVITDPAEPAVFNRLRCALHDLSVASPHIQALVSSGWPPALIQPFRALSQASPWARSPEIVRTCRSRRSRDVRLVRTVVLIARIVRHDGWVFRDFLCS